jgi:hypothetical protein
MSEDKTRAVSDMFSVLMGEASSATAAVCAQAIRPRLAVADTRSVLIMFASRKMLPPGAVD